MRILTALMLNALLLLSLPLNAQTAPAHRGPHGPMHYPVHIPTNLQVLPKNISPQQLIVIMRGYRSALGVECKFCHAEDTQTHHLNFASDDKPQKATARTMIRMTEEINAKYLSTIDDPQASTAQKTVTCSTCHRGRQRPAVFAAPARED